MRPRTQGNLERIFGRFGLQVRNAEEREGGRRRLGLPHRLDRGDLHLLVAAGCVAALVAEHDDRQRRGETEARGDSKRAPGELRNDARATCNRR